MHDKKKSESGKDPEQEALEKRVDAMMDPKQPDEPAAAPPEPAEEKPEPKITAVAVPATPSAAAASTAPQLSPKLRKQIAVSDAAAKPLSIDKLDELTKSITEPDSPKASKKAAKSEEKPEEKSEDKEDESEEKPEEPAETEPETVPDEAEDITEQSADLDDAQTDKAVDDIVAYEGDVMLAVADSTAEEHNREVAATHAPKGHPVLSFIVWTLVAIVAILVIALVVLLVMGDNLASRLGV